MAGCRTVTCLPGGWVECVASSTGTQVTTVCVNTQTITTSIVHVTLIQVYNVQNRIISYAFDLYQIHYHSILER